MKSWMIVIERNSKERQGEVGAAKAREVNRFETVCFV